MRVACAEKGAEAGEESGGLSEGLLSELICSSIRSRAEEEEGMSQSARPALEVGARVSW